MSDKAADQIPKVLGKVLWPRKIAYGIGGGREAIPKVNLDAEESG